MRVASPWAERIYRVRIWLPLKHRLRVAPLASQCPPEGAVFDRSSSWACSTVWADPAPCSPDASVNFYLLFLSRLGLRHSTQKTSCIVSRRKAEEFSRLFFFFFFSFFFFKFYVVHALFVDNISGFVQTDRVLSLQ